MTASEDPNEAREDGGFLAPRTDGEPVDHCFRCGAETPLGVGLCEEHNRGHISGPSPTQMHATIFGGIVLGVLALLILANLVMTDSGPFESTVTAVDKSGNGGVALSFTVTNAGDSEGVADCRVTRDGVPRPDDLAFRTQSLSAGESIALQRALAAPPAGSIGYDPEAITVVCT